jgi:hypothetical protein
LGYDAKEIARMEETGVVGPLNGVAS